jgi:VIT1/CCC1 family predicted Fe2+/Mn2+ transporter
MTEQQRATTARLLSALFIAWVMYILAVIFFYLVLYRTGHHAWFWVALVLSALGALNMAASQVERGSVRKSSEKNES